MNAQSLVWYFNTVKYLKFKQVIFRVYYLYGCFRVRCWISLLCLKKRGFKPALEGTNWFSPAVMPSRLSESGEFLFQGESGALTDPGIWNSPAYSKIWLYNIHYFDELNCIDAEKKHVIFKQYITSWIDNNPPAIGNGWEPYPLSLRIVNWIKWFRNSSVSPALSWETSLGMQAHVLMQCIEYHLLGNHIFANGKALVFAGSYFSGKAADAWLKKGLRILDRQIKEQFLADGGHFELSPMYHAILLWDMCDLVNLANLSKQTSLLSRKEQWESVIQRGLVWLTHMVHPDGNIAFFNDAAFENAPTLKDLSLYAQLLKIVLPPQHNISLQLLENTGYCVVNFANNSKAILDVGNVGPDYQPGHAHADTLSFELSLHGQRFLVNTGTSVYGNSPQRLYQRSTKAHNTVCIDDQSSTEVWSGFRVAKRARPRDLSWRLDVGKVIIGCSHDGYLRLAGRNLHHREWLFSENKITVRDVIIGRYFNAESRLHLHPAVNVMHHDGMMIVCSLPEGQTIKLQFYSASAVRVVPSTWHPSFGASVKNFCLIASFNKNELETCITWES